MMSGFWKRKIGVFAGLCLLGAVAYGANAQSVQHGRNYKAPPALAHIVVTVQKAFNGKPLVNAAVIFRATKNGVDSGNLEIKTDPDGNAIMDLIEADSHVMVQVIANGYATAAQEFDVTTADKNVLVKLQRPRAQVSDYQNTDGQAAPVQPGVQEHEKPAPGTPAPASPDKNQAPPPPADVKPAPPNGVLQ